MYSGAVKKMYCNTLLSIKFILGPVGSGFVPSRSKNLKTMEHSDAQLSIIRVFQYFQVLWSGTLFLHLVLLGFVGVSRSFLYLPVFTYRIGEHVQPPGQPPDGSRRVSRAADRRQHEAAFFFLHPHLVL